jgi:hypothetical protein
MSLAAITDHCDLTALDQINISIPIIIYAHRVVLRVKAGVAASDRT